MTKQIVIAAIVAGMALSSPTAQAWGAVIHPGSHVFDAKRFFDSVKETAQMVETVKNEVQKLKNQIIAMMRIDLYPREMEDAVKSALKFPEIRTIFNPKADDPLHRLYIDAITDYEHGGDPLSLIRKRDMDDNLTYRNIAADTVQRQEERRRLAAQIASASDDSLLSERQKANQLAALKAIGSIDEAQLIGTAYTNAVKEQETAYIKENIQREDAQRMTVYPYDPFHPTDFDKRNNKSESKAFGFLKFGQ